MEKKGLSVAEKRQKDAARKREYRNNESEERMKERLKEGRPYLHMHTQN